MDGSKGYYAKENKSEKDNIILTYLWNLVHKINKQ